MPDARDAGSIIEAAERAAESGNYTSAEDLLREAARLQETSLGPRHPDLANTLNNLGIVCEVTGKPADAEQYFRRAVSIARTSLAPDHPFVATSQKNLREFCEARGKHVEPPAPAPRSRVEPEPEDPEVTSKKFFGRLAVGALGPIAMLMVVLAAGLPRLGSPPELAAPSPAIGSESPQSVTTPLAIAADEPAPTTQEATVAQTDVDEASASVVVPASTARPATTPVRLVVVRASLCGDLDEWLCDPADRPVPLGPLFFYTQIKSSSATRIQHRWYHDERLLHSVELRIQPSAGGYRSFSRNVMTSDSVGTWRVELRSEEGALLHEERFTVR